MANYGIDQFGKPVGSDQTTPFTSTAKPRQQNCPSGQQWDPTQGKCVPQQITDANTEARRVEGFLTGVTPQRAGTESGPTTPPATTQPTKAVPRPPAGAGSQPCPPGYQWGPDNKCVPTAAPSPTGMTGNHAEFGKLWMASGGRTPQDLANFIKQHPEFGATITGSKGDKVTIGGRTFDAVIAAGLGGQGASWYDVTDGGGGGSSSVTGFLSAPNFVVPPGPTTPAPTAYQPTSSPAFRDVEAFQPSQLRGPTEDLILQLLANPSLSDSVVAQMKEAQKGSILDMSKQLQQQTLEDAARRGVAGGGATAASLGDIRQGALGDISSAYRDIDIQRALSGRAEQERAVGLSVQQQNQLLNEYTQVQALQQTANAREFEQWLSEQGVRLEASEFEYMNWLREQGLLLDYITLALGASQFDRTHTLAIAKFLGE